MPPLALTDDELTAVMNLAAVVPIQHRDEFLKSLAEALATCPEVGPGVVFREAAKLQRGFINAPTQIRANKYFR
jgi:hypothetical protein